MELAKLKLLVVLVALFAPLIYSARSEASPIEVFKLENLIPSPSTALWMVLFAVAGHFSFDFFFCPLSQPLDKSPPPTKTADAVNRTKQDGPTLPGFPNAWYKILDSHELNRMQIKRLQVLGYELVAFRGEDGKVAVLDAWCPHLGAHLALGKVVGNCVECPFHGWQFANDGQCTTIPYADKVPDFAKVAAWQVCEVNNMIHIYFDVDKRPPAYEIKVYPEMNGEFNFHGKSQHLVAAHIQEIPENGADVAHLNFLHVPFIVEKLGSLIRHRWEASWAPGEEKDKEAHIGKMFLVHELSILGKVIPGTKVEVRINQIGPSLVYLEFFLPFGKCIIVESVTPVGPLLQHCEHVVYAQRHIPRFIAKIVLRSLIIQFERDVPIWNSKAFLSKPILVKQDGKIPHFRRWFSQFYSRNDDGSFKKPENLSW